MAHCIVTVTQSSRIATVMSCGSHMSMHSKLQQLSHVVCILAMLSDADPGLLHHSETDTDVCPNLRCYWNECPRDPLTEKSKPQVLIMVPLIVCIKSPIRHPYTDLWASVCRLQ